MSNFSIQWVLTFSNFILKIQKIIRTPPPIMGIHLGVFKLIPSHSHTLFRVWMWFPGCTFGLHLSMLLALVTSPNLGSWHTKHVQWSSDSLFCCFNFHKEMALNESAPSMCSMLMSSGIDKKMTLYL
jgi:hypothetical protein